MTNNQHGQVPEALIDLIDAYAETRHRCGGIYNARTEAARKTVIEALSGVQALSAAPAVDMAAVDERQAFEAWYKQDCAVAGVAAKMAAKSAWHARAALAASPTPPAEQPTPNTGHAEADRLIGRLMSSDPDFEDCWHAAALIQREIKGPDGFGTWREAAIAERLARVNQQAAPKAAPALSSTEQAWVLRSPAAIAELLTFIDLDHSQGVSMLGPEGCPPWPPKRYTELKEIGRKIIEQDPDCFDAELLSTFGVASPTPPAEQPDLSKLTERGAKAWAGVDAQALRDGTYQAATTTGAALGVEQAAPKAAPGELHDHQILAITTAYEQGVGKGRQAHESGKEIANPYDTGYRCDLAWQYGYEEGKEQAERIANAAPSTEQQAAPEAAPGEQNTVPAEWLEQAYREGWAACRDAETIGEEAEDWAFGNSTANSRMIDAQQAAPQQEAQEPIGWTTGITWRPNPRLQSEQVIKITRDAQPNYGYTTPIYTAPQQEAQEPTTIDQKTMELAESVGLIGPVSRIGDLHAAIQRFHDLICVNATIKAAVMAADVISGVATPARDYPPLPMQFACSGVFPVYSANQMRAYVDADRAAYAPGSSQPAPTPLSEMPYEKRKAIQEGEQIGASDAWFHARHNMLDTLDRRNVFRAGFDRGWNAAIAAQGGKA